MLRKISFFVEAEVFGSTIKVSNDEVPTVVGRIIETPEDADNLKVPSVHSGRTGLYIKSVEEAVKNIKDRPVFCGVIGPFSLAGRLMDMTEIMANCYDEPDMVKVTLEKCTEFSIAYINEYKKAGANGVVMAEPAAGLLSPGLAEEFSCDYVKRIADAVKADDFLFVYHNCGPNVTFMTESFKKIGADIYHHGDASVMLDIIKKYPPDVIVGGNISPSNHFRNGTPEGIYKATTDLLNECGGYKNFLISSGCDIPPMSKWENIDSFFKAVKDYYK